MLYAKCRRGVAALEFGLAAPAFALVLLGASDVVQTLRTKLRLDSTAQQIGQVVSQCNTISTPGDTTQFWAEAQRLLGTRADVLGTDPSSTVPDGAVIISAVYRDGATDRVAWQIRTGPATQASAIGSAGGTARLPTGYAPAADQTIIVTEVVAPVQTWLHSSGILGEGQAATLGATTLLVSRSLDPVKLRQPLTSSTAMACTA